jgi:hypothetical protein
MFFVGFPTIDERKEIVEIMNRKFNSKIPTDNSFLDSLDGWTGAEISALAKDSLFENSIEDAMKGIHLIKKTKPQEIEKLIEFGKRLKQANKSVTNKLHKRKIDLRRVSTKSTLDDDFKAKITKTLREE